MSDEIQAVENEIEPIEYVDSEQAISAFGHYLERERAELTADSYMLSVGRFESWLEKLDPPLNLAQVDRSIVIEWRDELRKTYAVSTVNLRISAVRAFYQWAIEQGAPIEDPTASVKVRGAGGRGSRRHKRDELSDAEIRAVIKTTRRGIREKPTDLRDRAILGLMAYCGLRTIEIVRANVGDLETKSGRRILWVWGKGRSEPDDFVVIPATCEEMLGEWLAAKPSEGGPLFVSMNRNTRGGRLSTRFIRSMIKKRFRKAGIRSPKKTAHSLRHSAISNAIRRGATPLQVRSMARHMDIKTTLNYYHETDRLVKPAEDLIDYSADKD